MKVIEVSNETRYFKYKCIQKQVIKFLQSIDIHVEANPYDRKLFTLQRMYTVYERKWYQLCSQQVIKCEDIGSMYIGTSERYMYKPSNNKYVAFIEIDTKYGTVDYDIFKDSLITSIEDGKYSEYVNMRITIPIKEC